MIKSIPLVLSLLLTQVAWAEDENEVPYNPEGTTITKENLVFTDTGHFLTKKVKPWIEQGDYSPTHEAKIACYIRALVEIEQERLRKNK